MDVQIETSRGVETFGMNELEGLWHCVRKVPEPDFPLIGLANGKRYMLYSDGTFAEVELGPRDQA